MLSKKPKSSSWTQKFVCLSGTSDDRVPTTSVVREALSLAGLGEKKIQIYGVDCSTEAFQREVHPLPRVDDLLARAKVFSKLDADFGRFHLLRNQDC